MVIRLLGSGIHSAANGRTEFDQATVGSTDVRHGLAPRFSRRFGYDRSTSGNRVRDGDRNIVGNKGNLRTRWLGKFRQFRVSVGEVRITERMSSERKRRFTRFKFGVVAALVYESRREPECVAVKFDSCKYVRDIDDCVAELHVTWFRV